MLTRNALVSLLLLAASFAAQAAHASQKWVPHPYQKLAAFGIFQTAGPAANLVIPSQNNVSANWQKAGLQSTGGIPTRNTICATVAGPSGLKPPQAGDDQHIIQAAINSCPTGQVVLLPTGTWNFDYASFQGLQITNGVTLRGSGNCTQAGSPIAPYCQTWLRYINGAQPTYAAGNQFTCGSLNSTGVGSLAFSVANPTVVTWTNHGFAPGTLIVIYNSVGTLPTGIPPATSFYVLSAGLGTNSFEITTDGTLGPGGTGTPVAVTGAGSGQTNALRPIICQSSSLIFMGASIAASDYGFRGAGTNGCGHGNPCNVGIPLMQDAAQGDTKVFVSDSSSFTVGEYVYVDEASGSNWQPDPIYVTQFTGSLNSSGLLTVSAMTNGAIAVGQNLVGPGIPVGTPGAAGVTGSPKIISLGTGIGGTGTYQTDSSGLTIPGGTAIEGHLQIWASHDFQQTSPFSSPATARLYWSQHNQNSPALVDDLSGTTQYPYNTNQYFGTCGYGINCDRATNETKKISAIGSTCTGVLNAGCWLQFDSPLTVAMRIANTDTGGVGTGYISSGAGSSSAGLILTLTSITSGTFGVGMPIWYAGQTQQTTFGTPNAYITGAGPGTPGLSWQLDNKITFAGTPYSTTNINTPSAPTPVTIYANGHNAQVLHFSNQSGSSALVVSTGNGVENLSVSGSPGGNVNLAWCASCYVKGVDSFGWIGGAVNIQYSMRNQVTGSMLRDCYDCENNGAEYALACDAGCTESLVDNNIFLRVGKAMVGRACGGGNVISYNYADDTFYMASGGIGNYFIDNSVNMSHFKGCHEALLEGNWTVTCGDDSTHGSIYLNTYFRNQCAGWRTPFSSPDFSQPTSSTYNLTNAPEQDYPTPICFATSLAYPYSGCGPPNAIRPQMWNYGHVFTGNVIGTPSVTTAGNGYAYSGQYGVTSGYFIVALSLNGLSPFGQDPLNSSLTSGYTWMDGNYDFVRNTVTWRNSSHTLPSTLYSTGTPSFFTGTTCTFPYPWIDSTSGTPIKSASGPGGCSSLVALPAKARWDNGAPMAANP